MRRTLNTHTDGRRRAADGHPEARRRGAEDDVEARRRDQFAASAPIFAALGDETRLRLVARLCDGGPMSIARLTDAFPITRQAITKHLRMMETAGLVQSAQNGRESVWQLEPKRLDEARRHLAEISAQWDLVLARLKRFVER